MPHDPKYNELATSVDVEVTYTNRLLCQFGSYDLSPYTVSFSRLVLSRYKASPNGERIFFYNLTNLPVWKAADPRLEFGWYENSVWRNVGVHSFGYEHLLLTSAIVECLSEDYAAAVLDCLGECLDDEQRPPPSLRSWKTLAHAVNGLLTTSDFALMVDDRMRLDPYRVTSGHSTSCTNSLIAPCEFAKALEAIGKLSVTGSGELTLVGGNFIGWFAAFTELFLGINIEISSRDGETLYATKQDSNALLRCIFVDDINNLTPTIQSQTPKTFALTVMCRPDEEANAIPRVPFTGRVAWDSLLPKTFESSFHLIAHQHSKMLVQSIGGVARLFALIAQDPQTDLISDDNRKNSAALGLGLIQTICNWFPELRHLQGRMEKLQNLDSDAAAAKCDEGARAFVQACNCTICFLPYYADRDPNVLPQSFCLLAIMETILNLGLAMSRITVAPRIYPSRAGVLCIYQRQIQKLLEAKREYGETQIKWTRMRTLFGRDFNANYSGRLQNVIAIFSGSWPKDDITDNLIAISHEGICANILKVQHDDQRPTRQDAEVIRVQAGQIAWKQNTYSRLTVGWPVGISQSDNSWERVKCEHLAGDLYCK